MATPPSLICVMKSYFSLSLLFSSLRKFASYLQLNLQLYFFKLFFPQVFHPEGTHKIFEMLLSVILLPLTDSLCMLVFFNRINRSLPPICMCLCRMNNYNIPFYDNSIMPVSGKCVMHLQGCLCFFCRRLSIGLNLEVNSYYGTWMAIWVCGCIWFCRLSSTVDAFRG